MAHAGGSPTDSIHIVFSGDFSHISVVKCFKTRLDAEKFRDKYISMHDKNRRGYEESFSHIGEYAIE